MCRLHERPSLADRGSDAFHVLAAVLHSIIHLSYNRVMHRLGAFALSNAVLVALWIVAGMHVASGASG